MRITDNINLYNRAFALAWCQITPPQTTAESLELSERLTAIIRSSINAGLEDAKTIADAAVAALRK